MIKKLKNKRVIQFLITFLAAWIMLGGIDSFAQGLDEQELKDIGEITWQEEEDVADIPSDGEDPQELFSEYVEHVMTGSDTSITKRMNKRNVGDRLNGVEAAIYSKLSERALQIADGSLASSKVEIPVEELGLERTRWTAAQLGVTAIVKDNQITNEAADALRSKGAYDLRKIILMAVTDHPYEMYWFDKTAQTKASGYTISATYNDETREYELGFKGDLVISLPVAEEFASGRYTVDTLAGQSVQAALKRARAIIATYANQTDYVKLDGYRREICKLVSYDETVDANRTKFGNPWQIISVFDGDPSTNAVCEGYAKAFQYLCDMTAFSKDIYCYTVTGVISRDSGSGAHMWNIVTMGDGRHYLADITNCDSGCLGEADQLFLEGYRSGDIRQGYTFACKNGWIKYTYDNDTWSVFRRDELTLSSAVYAGKATRDAGTPIITAGWKKNSRGWYYVRTDGTYSRSQWEYINGKYYYFNAEGYMLTGWLQDKGIWYYLDSSGAMATGWRKVGGTWYYLNPSGAMATGWKKVGGTWYYLNPSGAMATGWRKVGGTWYYLDSSGAMVTGWLKDKGTWYYLKGSGAMAESEWCDGYWLSAGGGWSYTYRGSWKKNSRGWWFEDTSGWYAKNETIRINQVLYQFDSSGYLIE